eukprot:scaffold41077_cov150-Skeletonema_dohrnii-CCMP3373.AAC.2
MDLMRGCSSATILGESPSLPTYREDCKHTLPLSHLPMYVHRTIQNLIDQNHDDFLAATPTTYSSRCQYPLPIPVQL